MKKSLSSTNVTVKFASMGKISKGHFDATKAVAFVAWVADYHAECLKKHAASSQLAKKKSAITADMKKKQASLELAIKDGAMDTIRANQSAIDELQSKYDVLSEESSRLSKDFGDWMKSTYAADCKRLYADYVTAYNSTTDKAVTAFKLAVANWLLSVSCPMDQVKKREVTLISRKLDAVSTRNNGDDMRKTGKHRKQLSEAKFRMLLMDILNDVFEVGKPEIKVDEK